MTEYSVCVEYDGFSPEFDDKLRKAIGRFPSGSGFGLGRRDMDWYTNTEARAKKLAVKLRAVRGKRKTVTIHKVEY